MSAPKDNRDFFRIVKVATTLCLGSMAGFIYSIKAVHPAVHMEFGIGTVLITLLFGGASWKFFGVIFRDEEKYGATDSSAPGARRPMTRLWLAGFGLLMAIGVVAGFMRSLRGVSPDKLQEVGEGVLGAVLLMSFVGFMWWRVIRFFEDQSKAELDRQEKEDSGKSSD